MKKTTLMAFLLALLAPYAATSSTTESNRVYSKDGNTTSGVDSKNKAGGSVGTFYAYAKADPGWKFVKWTDTSGALLSDKAEFGSFSLTASSTSGETLTTEYQAYFEKEVLPSFSITFVTSDAGSYTVDGSTPANKTVTEVTSVVLKSTDPNFLSWNVGGTTVSDNPYTATCLTDTTISANFLTADQVTSVTTLADLTAALSNAAYKKIIIPSGTEIVQTSGTLTIPSGKQLVVEGTIFVFGTLSNSGTISGTGTIAKTTKTVTQPGWIVFR